MDVAKIAICVSFFRLIAQFFGDFDVVFMVVYGCFRISETVMGDT